MVDTPHYDGPTTAERFVDDMAAGRALQRLRLDVPTTLQVPAIAARYFVGAQVADGDDIRSARRFVFIDGSAAKLNRRDRWVVN